MFHCKKLLAVLISLQVLTVAVSCFNNPVGPDNPVFGTLTDIDGNVYTTVRIGKQEWLAENLRVTRYNDGTEIPHVTDKAEWAALTTPGYCYYNNATHADTIKKWGALYNWYVSSPANPQQIAPAGWRVSTVADWTVLENYLIANGYNWDNTTTGNKMAKSMAAKTDWASSTIAGAIGNDLEKNNISGFSALPGGFRYSDGVFYVQSYEGHWWSPGVHAYYDTWLHKLGSGRNSLSKDSNAKSCGFSLRLVRN